MNGLQSTNWLPGLLALSLALVAAGLYTFFSWGRRKGQSPPSDGPLADAEQRSQKLLDQLKELTVEKHHLTAEQFAAEKERLEKEAAEALRERDLLRGAQTTVPAGGPTDAASGGTTTSASAKGFFRRHPQLVGASWGAAVVLFFGLVAWTLQHEERPRGPNGTMTGMTPPGNPEPGNTSQQTATPEDDLQPALAQLKSHPEDVELAARVGHELIRRRDFQQARDVTNRALGVDPFNTEHLAHRAFLRATFGDEKGATEALQHVADVYPESYEALLFLGMVQMGSGHNAEALTALERFMKEAPPQEFPPQLANAVVRLRRQVGAAP